MTYYIIEDVILVVGYRYSKISNNQEYLFCGKVVNKKSYKELYAFINLSLLNTLYNIDYRKYNAKELINEIKIRKIDSNKIIEYFEEVVFKANLGTIDYNLDLAEKNIFEYIRESNNEYALVKGKTVYDKNIDNQNQCMLKNTTKNNKVFAVNIGLKCLGWNKKSVVKNIIRKLGNKYSCTDVQKSKNLFSYNVSLSKNVYFYDEKILKTIIISTLVKKNISLDDILYIEIKEE